MSEEQLAPFGRSVMDRLNKIKKDEEWLITTLRSKGNFMTREQLRSVLSGETVSRPRQTMIGTVLHEEEQRQRLKKIAGIKG